MTNYSYILAPHTAGNYGVLQEATAKYSDLLQERRVKFVFKKSGGDILDEQGMLLVPADAQQFIYMKATTAELDFELLEGVTSYSIYSADNQPFGEYWL